MNQNYLHMCVFSSGIQALSGQGLCLIHVLVPPSASCKADSLYLSLSKLLTLIGGYNTAYNVAILQVEDGWIMSTWTLGALARERPARVQHWPAGRCSDQESTEYILCSVFQNFTQKLNITDLHFTTWQFVIKSGLKLLPWSSSSYKISIWLQAANNFSYSKNLHHCVGCYLILYLK